VKVDILHTLGRLEGDAVLEIIRPYLQSSNSTVKNQAIASAVSVGENKVLADFLDMISTSNEEDIEAIKKSLLTMDGTDISDQVAKALPEASDEAKVALTEVLAARPSSTHMDVILEEVASTNNEVKYAALYALSSLAAPSHLDKLVSLLKNHQHPEELKLIQMVIIAANAQQDNKSQQITWTLETLKTLPDDKQVYLYDVLAHTGGTTALSSLSNIYQTGNVGQKKAALVAIANWSDAEAMEVLFDIAENDVNEDHSNQALEGYINLIKTTSHQPEGKVLLLRKALEIAKSDINKQLILTSLTQYPTFQGLLVAGRHLDDPAVQQEAARAVMGIALADTSFYGDEVRQIVQKTIEVIS